MTSSGNNFNDFSEIQLNKFRVVWTILRLIGTPYLKHAWLQEDAGTVAYAITGRNAERFFQCGWCLAFYLCYILFINFNSNINRHVLLGLYFIENVLVLRKHVVLVLVCCPGFNDAATAWIAVIAHWTTVPLSTASRLSRLIDLYKRT